jgi:cobalt/nickel transport system permease protein
MRGCYKMLQNVAEKKMLIHRAAQRRVNYERMSENVRKCPIQKRLRLVNMSLNVEHLSLRDSVIARWDARWRLAAVVLAMGAIAALRFADTIAVAFALAITVALIARVPRRWFLARLGALFFALLPFLVILPLTVDRGGPSFELIGLRLSLNGVIAAAAVIWKALAIVSLALVLLAAAPLHVTLRAAQRLYVPRLLVQLTLLSYRYVFLILDELNRIRVAVRVRGFRNRMNRHSYHTIGQVTGTLLVRGTERAERVAQAMRCRGFDGQFRSLDAFRATGRDVLLFAGIVFGFAALVAWDYLQ